MKKILITILIIIVFLSGCSLQPKITKQNLPEQKSQTREIMLGADSGARSPGTVVANNYGNKIWTDPDNVKISDNSYATTTLLSTDSLDSMDVSNFGFSIPTGATIDGAMVEFEGKTIIGSVPNFCVTVPISDTERCTTITTTEQYYSIGGPTEKWNDALTPGVINNSSFGVGGFAPTSGIGRPTETFNIDHIRITVYYTESASANPSPSTSGVIFFE